YGGGQQHDQHRCNYQSKRTGPDFHASTSSPCSSGAASRCNQVGAFQRRYCRCRHYGSWRCGFARAVASSVSCSKSDAGSEYSSAKHVASRSDAAHWDATGKRQAADRRSAIAYSFAAIAGYSWPSAEDSPSRDQRWSAATRCWRVPAAAGKRQAARRGFAVAYSSADTAASRPSAEAVCPRYQSRTAPTRCRRTTAAAGQWQATRRGSTAACSFAASTVGYSGARAKNHIARIQRRTTAIKIWQTVVAIRQHEASRCGPTSVAANSAKAAV